MDTFPDADEWLFEPVPGPPAPLLGTDAGPVDALDDLFSLLIEPPAPGTAARADEAAAAAAPASAPAGRPGPPGPQSSPSSSGRSALDEDGTESASEPRAKAKAQGRAEAQGDAQVDAQADGKPPARKKKRRKRPKDELDYLRRAVAELEQQLAALRVVESPAAAAATAAVDADADAEWAEIALHQRHEAESARATNAQLRSMLEGQLSVAQQLQQALQQHLKMARIDGMDAAVRSRAADANADADADTNSQLLEGLTAKLGELYSRVDAVLASVEFSAGTDRERSRMLKENDRGAYFEISNTHRLPFPVPAVSRALWRGIMINCSTLARGWVRHLDDDTINFGYMESIPSTHAPGASVTIKASIRRYNERDRVVTVWSSMVEIDGSMYVRLREDGWGVVAPVAARGAARTDAEVSRMQNVVHVTPEVATVASIEEQRAHVGEMTDLVLGTYRRLVRKVHQTVENLLLADALGGEISS